MEKQIILCACHIMLCRYVARLLSRVGTIYIGDIYPIFSGSKLSGIFDIFKVGYFPYFFNITLLLDVKTSLKCGHFKVQYCLLFLKHFLPLDAHNVKCGIAIVIILSSPILKYRT